jgi:hypothetical protein
MTEKLLSKRDRKLFSDPKLQGYTDEEIKKFSVYGSYTNIKTAVINKVSSMSEEEIFNYIFPVELDYYLSYPEEIDNQLDIERG